jgi:hypothetical protein
VARLAVAGAHLVFIRRMLQRGTLRSMMGSHLAITGAMASRSCLRCQSCSSLTRASVSVPSRDVHQESIAVDLDVRSPGPLDDLQPVAGAPDVVRFTGNHLAWRLARRVL